MNDDDCRAAGDTCCGQDTDAAELPPDAAALREDAGPLRRAAFDAIRQGEPVGAAALAATSGLTVSEVDELLARLDGGGRVRLDDHRRVVGIAGLSLEPTPHRLSLNGAWRFTWCALDAVAIPAALAVDAEVITSCWHCDTEIAVTLPGGQPPASRPERLWLPHPASTNSLQDFCPLANLFCDTKHLELWRAAAGDPPGQPLDLVEAAEHRDGWAELAIPPT